MADQEHLNPNLFGGKRKVPEKPSKEALFEGIKSGDRASLSRGITLIESSKAADRADANWLIKACLPLAGNSVRVGITGLPGAGKSSLIEVFGLKMIAQGKKLAVLAVDPTSSISQGSILGDKTRMESLSTNDSAFIRPSPTGSTLGGVNRRTRESIVLCEAAGYDLIFVETVGVGQSESSVHSLTDFFLLVLLTGAGDELQGIKKGVMELADLVLINKADGNNLLKAKQTKAELARAMHFQAAHPGGWVPQVLLSSALEKTGLDEVWAQIQEYKKQCEKTGYWLENRKQQRLFWFKNSLSQALEDRILSSPGAKQKLDVLLKQIEQAEIDPFSAVDVLLDQLFKS